MNEGLIARRYAEALLKFSIKRGAATAVYEKMKLFERNYISHPDLHKALMNPLLSAHDKEMLLSTAVEIEPGDVYIKGIRLLIKNHREMYIRSICLMYQQLYREMFHIKRVKVITAMKISEEMTKRISELADLRNSDKMEVENYVDASLIGGFILQVDSVQIDASIRKNLKELQRKLK